MKRVNKPLYGMIVDDSGLKMVREINIKRTKVKTYQPTGEPGKWDPGRRLRSPTLRKTKKGTFILVSRTRWLLLRLLLRLQDQKTD